MRPPKTDTWNPKHNLEQSGKIQIIVFLYDDALYTLLSHHQWLVNAEQQI